MAFQSYYKQNITTTADALAHMSAKELATNMNLYKDNTIIIFYSFMVVF